MVCGDFNLPKVKWPETGFWVNNEGQEEDEFVNGGDDCFISQILSRSTFGENGIGGNILELILTSDPERILEMAQNCPRKLQTNILGCMVQDLGYEA